MMDLFFCLTPGFAVMFFPVLCTALAPVKFQVGAYFINVNPLLLPLAHDVCCKCVRTIGLRFVFVRRKQSGKAFRLRKCIRTQTQCVRRNEVVWVCEIRELEGV